MGVGGGLGRLLVLLLTDIFLSLFMYTCTVCGDNYLGLFPSFGEKKIEFFNSTIFYCLLNF